MFVRLILIFALLINTVKVTSQNLDCNGKDSSYYTNTSAYPKHTRITRCSLTESNIDLSKLELILYIDWIVDSNICKLTNATEIVFINPEIKEIPSEIGKLKKLKSIRFELSHFDTLPNTFWDLENLEELYFVKCFKFNFLPKSIENFKNLRLFGYTYGDKFEFDPKSFERLAKLKNLYFNHSKIRKDNFDSLQKLENCKVHWN